MSKSLDPTPQAAWYDLTLARGILCHPEARETLASEGGGRVHAHLHHARQHKFCALEV